MGANLRARKLVSIGVFTIFIGLSAGVVCQNPLPRVDDRRAACELGANAPRTRSVGRPTRGAQKSH
jgi:hypothetical protein